MIADWIHTHISRAFVVADHHCATAARKRILALAFLACALFGTFGVTAQAQAYPSTKAQGDRVDASLSVDMPLPGETTEWRMSSGDVGYESAEIYFEILDVSGVYGDVDQWVSVDLTEGDGRVVASGITLGQLAGWSFTCTQVSSAGCKLKATLRLDSGAGNETRDQRIHIRWMFIVQDTAAGDFADANFTGHLSVTGVSVLTFGSGVVLLMAVGILLASLRRRVLRKGVVRKKPIHRTVQ